MWYRCLGTSGKEHQKPGNSTNEVCTIFTGYNKTRSSMNYRHQKEIIWS